MEIITVHTTQNIDIEYEIGGLGERILAKLIDYVIFVPFLFAGIFLSGALSGWALGAYYIILVLLFAFYDLLCEVFFNGQSLGKRVMKIRVISLEGARPKFSQYLLRWLFRMVDFGITGGVGALVTAVMTENCQRVGDVVAGTAMIRTTPRTSADNLVFTNIDETYQPVFAQASQLADRDIGLIHEVIESYFKTGSNVIVYRTAERIKELLSVTPPPQMNSLLFLQTIVKDYSHIAARAETL
ncbi:MAG: RDD family protein [Bacteroidota bacterium]|nr:RDD family protein [Bacteroidota bacterium]